MGRRPLDRSPSAPTPPRDVEGTALVLKNLLAAPLRSELLTLLFWREVLSRAVRQGLQTLVPVLGAAALTGGLQGIDYGSVGLILLGSEVVVVLRAVFEVRVPAGAALPEQLVDRAAAAFAGSLLGVLIANHADVIHTSWGASLGVAGAAAVASAVHLFADALGLPLSGDPGNPPATAYPTVPGGVYDDAVPVDSSDYADGAYAGDLDDDFDEDELPAPRN